MRAAVLAEPCHLCDLSAQPEGIFPVFFRRGVGPLLDRSAGDAYAVMTARASRASSTARTLIVPALRSTAVLAWWARPRAAIRIQAPVSRSPCQPQPGQTAHFQPGSDGRSGALRCRRTARQCGQHREVPPGGTVTTAMPSFAARWRVQLAIFPRTA